MGYLGDAPEIRTLENGEKVASFSIGCTKTWKDGQGERKQKTEWVRCSAWRALAEIIEKLGIKKGSPVLVESEFTTREYVDKKDNIKKQAVEFVVTEFTLLPSKDGGAPNPETAQAQPAQQPGTAAPAQVAPSEAVGNMDLPF